MRRILLHKSNAKCGLLCDLIRVEGAEALAHYGEDFYAGSPAATKHNFGKGAVYYTGTQPDKEGLARLLGGAAAQAGVKPLLDEETALEVARRVKDGKEYWFVLNLTGKAQPLPACFAGDIDLLTGRDATAEMEPFDGMVFYR